MYLEYKWCLFLPTDAPESIRVCSLCEIPVGGTEAVFRVGLHRQRRTPVLHGQREGGGGHVHEYGVGPFPAGEAQIGS